MVGKFDALGVKPTADHVLVYDNFFLDVYLSDGRIRSLSIVINLSVDSIIP